MGLTPRNSRSQLNNPFHSPKDSRGRLKKKSLNIEETFGPLPSSQSIRQQQETWTTGGFLFHHSTAGSCDSAPGQKHLGTIRLLRNNHQLDGESCSGSDHDSCCCDEAESTSNSVCTSDELKTAMEREQKVGRSEFI